MIDPTVIAALGNLGLGVAASGIYDAIKGYLTSTPAPNRAGLEAAIQNRMAISGTTISASTVVDFLAKSGVITISGSHIYGPNGVTIGSANGIFALGNGSISRTDKTMISTPLGGGIQGSGNTAIRQNPDGSISFHVGNDGQSSIGFYVPKK